MEDNLKDMGLDCVSLSCFFVLNTNGWMGEWEREKWSVPSLNPVLDIHVALTYVLPPNYTLETCVRNKWN